MARTRILRAFWFADRRHVVFLWYYVLFCFDFVFLLSLKPRSFVVRYSCAPTATRNNLITSACVLPSFVFVSSFFCFFRMSVFPIYIVFFLKKNLNASRPSEHPSVRSEGKSSINYSLYLCMESTSNVFPFRMVFFFYLVTTGWVFDIILRENSTNQSNNQ